MNEEEVKTIKYFLTEEQLIDYTRKVIHLIREKCTFEPWYAEDRLGDDTEEDAWYFWDTHGDTYTINDLIE
jgi:hypothetical protein